MEFVNILILTNLIVSLNSIHFKNAHKLQNFLDRVKPILNKTTEKEINSNSLKNNTAHDNNHINVSSPIPKHYTTVAKNTKTDEKLNSKLKSFFSLKWFWYLFHSKTNRSKRKIDTNELKTLHKRFKKLLTRYDDFIKEVNTLNETNLDILQLQISELLKLKKKYETAKGLEDSIKKINKDIKFGEKLITKLGNKILIIPNDSIRAKINSIRVLSDKNIHYFLNVTWRGTAIISVEILTTNFLKKIYVSHFNGNSLLLTILGEKLSELRLTDRKNEIDYKLNDNCGQAITQRQSTIRLCKEHFKKAIILGKFRANLTGTFVSTVIIVYGTKLNKKALSIYYSLRVDDKLQPTDLELPKNVIKKKRQNRAAQLWAEWSSWSACSVSCDAGQRNRYRDCLNMKCERQKELLVCIMSACSLDRVFEVVGTLGKDIKLICKISNPRKIFWVDHDKKPIKNNDRYKIGKDHLNISDLIDEDFGRYHCIHKKYNGIIETADVLLKHGDGSISRTVVLCKNNVKNCRNEGYCQMINGDPICVCTKFFKGELCQDEIYGYGFAILILSSFVFVGLSILMCIRYHMLRIQRYRKKEHEKFINNLKLIGQQQKQDEEEEDKEKNLVEELTAASKSKSSTDFIEGSDVSDEVKKDMSSTIPPGGDDTLQKPTAVSDSEAGLPASTIVNVTDNKSEDVLEKDKKSKIKKKKKISKFMNFFRSNDVKVISSKSDDISDLRSVKDNKKTEKKLPIKSIGIPVSKKSKSVSSVKDPSLLRLDELKKKKKEDVIYTPNEPPMQPDFVNNSSPTNTEYCQTSLKYRPNKYTKNFKKKKGIKLPTKTKLEDIQSEEHVVFDSGLQTRSAAAAATAASATEMKRQVVNNNRIKFTDDTKNGGDGNDDNGGDDDNAVINKNLTQAKRLKKKAVRKLQKKLGDSESIAAVKR